MIVDIEVTPDLGYVWEKYETNVLSYYKYGQLLSFSCKWYGENTTHMFSLRNMSEKQLVKKLWFFLDEADIAIAHNGNAYDFKKANAYFLKHNFSAPSPYKTIDTKLVAKRYFKFVSNKLDDLGDYLGIGRKAQTGGFDLWLACMARDNKAFKKMEEYNKQDVVLLEKVYEKMLPYMNNHPNIGLMNGLILACPNCGSEHIQKRGIAYTRVSVYQRMQCMDCFSWSQTPKEGKQVR